MSMKQMWGMLRTAQLCRMAKKKNIIIDFETVREVTLYNNSLFIQMAGIWRQSH